MVFQEILLMDIISIEMSKMRAPVSEISKAPHVFEIRLQNITYFVGEDPTFGGREGDFLVSPESGTGLEQAWYWEHSIRQALMPVTPTSSITSEGKYLQGEYGTVTTTLVRLTPHCHRLSSSLSFDLKLMHFSFKNLS